MKNENQNGKVLEQDEYLALSNKFLGALSNAEQARSRGGNSARFYEEALGVMVAIRDYVNQGALGEIGNEILSAMQSRYQRSIGRISNINPGLQDHDRIRRVEA